MLGLFHILFALYAMLSLTKAGLFGLSGQAALKDVYFIGAFTHSEPVELTAHAYRRCPFPMWGMLIAHVAAVLVCHVLPMVVSAASRHLIVPHIQYPMLAMHAVLCIVCTAAVFSYRGCLLTTGPVYDALWLLSLAYLCFLPVATGAYYRAYELARKYEKQRRNAMRRTRATARGAASQALSEAEEAAARSRGASTRAGGMPLHQD